MLKAVKLLARYQNCNAGEVAGFPPDEAERLVAAGVAEWNDKAPPAPPAKKGPPPSARVRTSGAKDVQIPDDWRTAVDGKALLELAAALAEPAPKSRNEAIDVIEAELAARKA